MAKLQLKAGTTSYIAQVFIQDSSSTTGAGLTGLAFNSGSLTAYFHRDTDTTATAMSLVTMTVGTFTSLGFKEIDATNMPGWYQLCPPNTALASGAKSCAIHLKGATNMAPLPLEIELTGFDNQSTTDGNLSRLTSLTFTGANKVDASVRDWVGDTIPARNVAGVPLVDAKYLLGTVFATPATAGIIDVNVKNMNNVAATAITTIKAVQGLATDGVIPTATNLTNAPTAGDFTAVMKTSIGTAVAASAVASVTGNVGGNVTGSVGSVASGGITRASLAADTGLQSIRSNTAQAGAGTTITLDASASAVNSFYNNTLLVITGGTGVGQARFITAYVGATKVATVATWGTNPDNTSTFAIMAFDAVAGASAPTAAQVATAVWQDATGSDFTTTSSIGKRLTDNIDAAISSRMATYTQPSGFLAATFPTGTVANTTNITAATGVDITKILGTAISTPATAGILDVNVKNMNNVAGTPITTIKAVQGLAVDGVITTATNLTTNNDKTGYSIASGGIGSGAHAAAELNAIADALLDRNMATGADNGTDSTVVRTVRQALRRLRNKEAIAAGTGTIYKENDSTASWTYAAATTAGDPLSSVDPT